MKATIPKLQGLFQSAIQTTPTMSLQDPEKGFQPSGQHENGFDQRSENETMDSKAANILSSGASSPAATFTQASTAEDPSLVTFNGPDDPYNPYNLPMWKKWSYAIILGWLSLVVTFATSAFAPGTAQCATEFGVSIEVMYLATALFIAGQSSTHILLHELCPAYDSGEFHALNT
jgi:DHA1 family multidrug resistance protein-like MFS transporter